MEYIIDIETRPDPKLVDVFMEKKKAKRDKDLEKLKETVKGKEKKIRADYVREETVSKHINKLTVETLEKEEEINNTCKPANFRKAMSVDPDYAEIICIGIKEVGVAGSEKLYNPEQMVQWFQENVVSQGKAGHQDFKSCTLVTFNGKSFDLPLLLKTGLKHRLDYPYKIINNYCIKRNSNYFSAGDYDNDASRIKHIDLKHLIAGSTQVKDAKSLDEYMQIYLGREKDTKGEDFFANATKQEIERHCLDDLKDTEEMYLLFKKLI